tara:strand:- start:104 stop:694 length:591 start_codon:yes stop_codon:yes gene_type:complete
MLKKIIFQNILIYFVLVQNVQSAESGGMPQLNPEFWFSQIFWLVLTFGILYVVLSKFILPKISSNLEARKSQILENIEAAEKQRKDSEIKIKEFEKIILDSRTKAKNLLNEARKKIFEDINKKREALENEINEEVKVAEKEILDLKNNAPKKINRIAIETSNDLVKQLIGMEVNNSSISAIVEDLSKKNRGKYYGV